MAEQPDLFDAGPTPPKDAPAPRIRPRHPARRAHVRLIHGDFLEAAPRLVADGSIDAIVTSPPYNFDIPYSKYRDDMPRAEYLAWTGCWAASSQLSPPTTEITLVQITRIWNNRIGSKELPCNGCFRTST